MDINLNEATAAAEQAAKLEQEIEDRVCAEAFAELGIPDPRKVAEAKAEKEKEKKAPAIEPKLTPKPEPKPADTLTAAKPDADKKDTSPKPDLADEVAAIFARLKDSNRPGTAGSSRPAPKPPAPPAAHGPVPPPLTGKSFRDFNLTDLLEAPHEAGKPPEPVRPDEIADATNEEAAARRAAEASRTSGAAPEPAKASADETGMSWIDNEPHTPAPDETAPSPMPHEPSIPRDRATSIASLGLGTPVDRRSAPPVDRGGDEDEKPKIEPNFAAIEGSLYAMNLSIPPSNPQELRGYLDRIENIVAYNLGDRASEELYAHHGWSAAHIASGQGLPSTPESIRRNANEARAVALSIVEQYRDAAAPGPSPDHPEPRPRLERDIKEPPAPPEPPKPPLNTEERQVLKNVKAAASKLADLIASLGIDSADIMPSSQAAKERALIERRMGDRLKAAEAGDKEAILKVALEERKQLVAERIKLYQERGGPLGRLATKVVEGFNWLGKQNLQELGVAKRYEGGNKIADWVRNAAMRAANVRTGISLGLLGVSYGLSASTGVGAFAFAARRGLSGLGAMIGSYAALQREAQERGPVEALRRLKEQDIQALNTDKIIEHLATLEVRASASGEDVSTNPLYTQLLNAWGERLKSDIETYAAEQAKPEDAAATLVRIRMGELNDATQKELIRVQREKYRHLGLAGVTGLVAMSGYVGKAFGNIKRGLMGAKSWLMGPGVAPSTPAPEVVAGASPAPHATPSPLATPEPKPSPIPKGYDDGYRRSYSDMYEKSPKPTSTPSSSPSVEPTPSATPLPRTEASTAAPQPSPEASHAPVRVPGARVSPPPLEAPKAPPVARPDATTTPSVRVSAGPAQQAVETTPAAPSGRPEVFEIGATGAPDLDHVLRRLVLNGMEFKTPGAMDVLERAKLLNIHDNLEQLLLKGGKIGTINSTALNGALEWDKATQTLRVLDANKLQSVIHDLQAHASTPDMVERLRHGAVGYINNVPLKEWDAMLKAKFPEVTVAPETPYSPADNAIITGAEKSLFSDHLAESGIRGAKKIAVEGAHGESSGTFTVEDATGGSHTVKVADWKIVAVDGHPIKHPVSLNAENLNAEIDMETGTPDEVPTSGPATPQSDTLDLDEPSSPNVPTTEISASIESFPRGLLNAERLESVLGIASKSPSGQLQALSELLDQPNSSNAARIIRRVGGGLTTLFKREGEIYFSGNGGKKIVNTENVAAFVKTLLGR